MNVNGSVSLRGVPVKVLARSRAQVAAMFEALLAKIVSWLLLLSHKSVFLLIYSLFVNKRASV